MSVPSKNLIHPGNPHAFFSPRRIRRNSLPPGSRQVRNHGEWRKRAEIVRSQYKREVPSPIPNCAAPRTTEPPADPRKYSAVASWIETGAWEFGEQFLKRGSSCMSSVKVLNDSHFIPKKTRNLSDDIV